MLPSSLAMGFDNLQKPAFRFQSIVTCSLDLGEYILLAEVSEALVIWSRWADAIMLSFCDI